jgi:hypothetical protein
MSLYCRAQLCAAKLTLTVRSIRVVERRAARLRVGEPRKMADMMSDQKTNHVTCLHLWSIRDHARVVNTTSAKRERPKNEHKND